MKAAQGDEREPYKWHLTPDMDNKIFDEPHVAI